jgi:hypothetical protein
MFFIPRILITIATFPGIIVHELAHQFFCWLFKIPVFKVVYFQTGNPAGYVLHETVPNKFQHIMISIGPFIVNTVLGALIAFPAAFPVVKFETAGPADYLLIYLGVTIAMHAFPSVGDARSIWEGIKDEHTSILAKIFAYPIVGLIYVGALGSFFWLDLAYGIAVCVGLPDLIVALLT